MEEGLEIQTRFPKNPHRTQWGLGWRWVNNRCLCPVEMDAALCFYKALAVYPNPTDILGIYQRSVPEEVYEVW